MGEEQIVSRSLSPEKSLKFAYECVEEAKLHNPLVRAVFEMMRGIDLGESAPYVILCRFLLEENRSLKIHLIEQEMRKL